MASLRAYKLNGLFNPKVFRSCPAFPKVHAANCEPLVSQTPGEQEHQGQDPLPHQAVKLIGRADFVELDEQTQEVFVKDDLGIYILYDCALQDMKVLEEELVKTGSYFIHRAETLVDPEQRALPLRDRQQVAYDILG